jgi:hypothetical protein
VKFVAHCRALGLQSDQGVHTPHGVVAAGGRKRLPTLTIPDVSTGLAMTGSTPAPKCHVLFATVTLSTNAPPSNQHCRYLRRFANANAKKVKTQLNTLRESDVSDALVAYASVIISVCVCDVKDEIIKTTSCHCSTTERGISWSHVSTANECVPCSLSRCY